MPKGKKTKIEDAVEPVDVVPEPEDDNFEQQDTDTGARADAGSDEGEERAPPEVVRDERRDDIVERFRAMRARNAGDAEDEDEDEDPDEDDDVDEDAGDADEADEDEPAARPAAAKAAPKAPDDDFEVELRVDGKPVKKSYKEILALAQMNMAADSRLSEANRLLDEIKAIKAKPEDQPGDEPDGQPDRSPRAQTTGVDEGKLAEIAERIQVGTAEEGKQALVELIGVVSGKSVDADQVTKLVQSSLVLNQRQQDINAALDTFGKKYPKIVADEDLAETGLSMVQREMKRDMLALGIPPEHLKEIEGNRRAMSAAYQELLGRGHKLRPLGKLLDDVGDAMSAKYNLGERKKPDPKKPDAETRAATKHREERKKTLPSQPRHAALRDEPNKGQRPKTKREIVEQMRRDRRFA